MASKESENDADKLPTNNTDMLIKDELVSDAGKNVKWVVCQFCGSKVLQPNSGQYHEEEVGILKTVDLFLYHS